MHPCVAWGLGVLGFRVLAPLHVRAIWKAVAMLWACDPDLQIDIKAVSHNNPWVSELNIQSEALWGFVTAALESLSPYILKKRYLE